MLPGVIFFALKSLPAAKPFLFSAAWRAQIVLDKPARKSRPRKDLFYGRQRANTGRSCIESAAGSMLAL